MTAIYLWTVNLFALGMYGEDKRRAKKGLWRISEKTLLVIALIGGASGALFGMLLFRHKIRKPVFCLTVPFLAVLQWMCLYLTWRV